jgi:hypothetical protein
MQFIDQLNDNQVFKKDCVPLSAVGSGYSGYKDYISLLQNVLSIKRINE